MKKQTALDIICALLILLFVYTATNKLLNYPTFRKDMHNQPFADGIGDVIVILLPPMELIIAALLPFERTRRIGLWSSAVIMFAFTVYTIVVLLRFFGRIPCGCGGFIRTLSWSQHLVFNLFFTAIAMVGTMIHHKSSRRIETSPTS